jgi:hypothetical protein
MVWVMPETIPFREWTPDLPDRLNGALEAKGVVSIAGNYAPFKSFNDYNGSSAATTGACLGLKGVYDSNGDGQIFAGDATKLYFLVSRAPTDVSKSGGYTVGTDEWWGFEQFGDYVVAVAAGEAPQVYQMGVSSLFANLGGSPPSGATCVARINDFLMMGKDFTVHWSAFNDITSWSPSATTQAGNQELDQAQGKIQAIVGGEYAAIFQERAIRRAIYAGPPVIWDFGQDAVETKRGAIGPNATARFGRSIFFAADDGFYVFDGNASTPIGSGKVDGYFQRRLNYGYRHKVGVGIDTVNKFVVFGFPAGSATDISELLIYSLTDGRWTHDEVGLEWLTDMPVEALTVDNFHTYETSDDLDTNNLNSITVDSNVFDEKRRLLAGVTISNHRIGTFTGSNRQAIIETGEFEAAAGRRALVTEVWPVGDFEQGAVSVSIGHRHALPGASIQYSQSTGMNRAGYCPQRVDGRFLRARAQIAAGSIWTRAEGVHHTSVLTGGR